MLGIGYVVRSEAGGPNEDLWDPLRKMHNNTEAIGTTVIRLKVNGKPGTCMISHWSYATDWEKKLARSRGTPSSNQGVYARSQMPMKMLMDKCCNYCPLFIQLQILVLVIKTLNTYYLKSAHTCRPTFKCILNMYVYFCRTDIFKGDSI